MFAILALAVGDNVISEIGKFLIMIAAIREIQVERDTLNRAANEIPPDLPHEVIKLRTTGFDGRISDRYLRQLRHSWSEEIIAQIKHKYRQFRTRYQQDPTLEARFDKRDGDSRGMSFEAGYGRIEGCYDILRDFYGGITKVQINTARVCFRSGRARITPLDRVDRSYVGPKIHSYRSDRFKVGSCSDSDRPDRVLGEAKFGPCRVPDWAPDSD